MEYNRSHKQRLIHNNECKQTHYIQRDGNYYLFTQNRNHATKRKKTTGKENINFCNTKSSSRFIYDDIFIDTSQSWHNTRTIQSELDTMFIIHIE